MSVERRFINPFLFFLLKDGNIIGWDYKKHRQYELEEKYFQRILEIARHPGVASQEIDEELEEANFILHSNDDVQWGWDYLSKIFHFGTKISEDDLVNEKIADPKFFVAENIEYSTGLLDAFPDIYTEKAGDIVTLPEPDLISLQDIDLLRILSQRKTSRSFDGTSINLKTLSTLLYVVFSDFHQSNDDYAQYGFQKIGMRKTSPSCGGLHPSEAYIVALNVDGLDKGVYHYQAHKHVLSVISASNISPQMNKLLCGQYFAAQLAFGIFITSRFDKIWHKYKHSRAYRVALIDIGHLSQTFQLVATALGLNTWLSGVFVDTDVSSLLNIKDDSEQPLFFVGAGNGDNSPLDPLTKVKGQV